MSTCPNPFTHRDIKLFHQELPVMQVRACFNQTIVQPIGGLLAVDAGRDCLYCGSDHVGSSRLATSWQLLVVLRLARALRTTRSPQIFLRGHACSRLNPKPPDVSAPDSRIFESCTPGLVLQPDFSSSTFLVDASRSPETREFGFGWCVTGTIKPPLKHHA